MKIFQHLAIVAAIVALDLTLAGHAIGQAGLTIEFSAASKKKSSNVGQTQGSGQIACTVAGCHPIPPNCHPQTGYNWNGIPSGFDVVVCGPPRGRRG